MHFMFSQSFETPLDEYCKRDDGVFGYDALDVFEEDGATVYTFNMTSQLWMDGQSFSIIIIIVCF